MLRASFSADWSHILILDDDDNDDYDDDDDDDYDDEMQTPYI